MSSNSKLNATSMTPEAQSFHISPRTLCDFFSEQSLLHFLYHSLPSTQFLQHKPPNLQTYASIVKLLKQYCSSTQLHNITKLSTSSGTISSLTMNNPTQNSPERGLALQKYLLLHSQHDALQKHLDQITTSLPTTTRTSPSRSPDRYRYASLSSSPSSGTEDGMFLASSPPSSFRGNHHRSGSVATPLSRRPVIKARRSSLPTVIDESILGEIEEDEMKLKDVNLQIKSTLTDLLNCESVRGDKRYRMWVQTRLMDAERELKENRSRSSHRRMSEDNSEMIF
jgi:hypothetical protein